MDTKKQSSLSDFPNAKEGDLVLLVNDDNKYSNLFRIKSLHGGSNFQAEWGYILSLDHPEGCNPLPHLTKLERQYLDRDDIADHCYVGDKSVIVNGLNQHEKLRPYAHFLDVTHGANEYRMRLANDEMFEFSTGGGRYRMVDSDDK